MRHLIYILPLVFASITWAQQEPQFTQYFDNTLFQNPAYAGSNKMLSFNTMHREQWLGFEGRPSTTSFTLHSPLSYESVGLGISAIRDVIGPTTQHMVYGGFSYSLKINKQSSLAFGLKGGFNLINTKTDNLHTIDVADVALQENTLNRINPNFGFGMYYHAERFYLGISSPKLIESSIDGSPTNLEKRHFYVHTGAVFNMGSQWKIRPTAQLKSTTGAPLSIDLSNAFIYKDRMFMGATYRHQAAIGVFVQYQITQQFRFGVASDFATTAIRNYNQGTFEAMISYDFNFIKGGIRSPRYF